MEELLSALFEALTTLDTQVAYGVAAARTPLATKLFTSVTGLGSATAALVLVGLFRAAGWTRAFRRAGVALAVCGVAVGTLMLTVQRPFPPQPVCTTAGESVATSFPSGHAASATVFALVAHRSEALPTAVGAVLAAAVAVSRVYLGTHYLTDTVAGVVIGVLAFLLAGRVLARYSDQAAADVWGALSRVR